MAYTLTEVIAGNDIFSYKGHSTRYGLKVARGINLKPTTHHQKKINKRISIMRLLWLACANFIKGDYWITFTYTKHNRPENEKAAHKNIMDPLAKVRRKLKKKNIPLVYMCKTEKGQKGAIHHHLLIKNNFDIGLLMELWSFGRAELTKVYTNSLAALGQYFIKESENQSEKNRRKTIISHSRNMKKPIIKKRNIKSRTFADEPKEKKGYHIIHTYNGFQTCAGYLYQEYIQTKATPDSIEDGRLCFKLFEDITEIWEP